MNVNAVNILGNAGKTGQDANSVIKFIPSREEFFFLHRPNRRFKTGS